MPTQEEMLPQWTARKLAQYARALTRIPSLQLVRYGPDQSTFMLVCSTDDFYEGVIIGQPPRPQYEWRGGERRPVPAHRKQSDRRAIDLSDDDIDAILTRWQSGRSALGLPCVSTVWDRSGQMRGTMRNATRI
jgi:hypothetical protein